MFVPGKDRMPKLGRRVQPRVRFRGAAGVRKRSGNWPSRMAGGGVHPQDNGGWTFILSSVWSIRLILETQVGPRFI